MRRGEYRRFAATSNPFAFSLALTLLLVVQTTLGLNYDIVDLGTLGGTESRANGINSIGQVVGRSNVSGGGHHAFLYTGGAMTDLGTLGGVYSEAFSINDAGQVVGQANLLGSSYFKAFLWQSGTMTNLGTLGGVSSSGRSINLSGQVTGDATITGEYARAFRYEGGSMSSLGLPAGYTASAAYGINNSGVIVGWLETTGIRRAFLWSGTMTELGAVAGYPKTYAFAVNTAGHVVGRATDDAESSAVAVLWNGGVATTLGTLGGSGPQIGAYALNNTGAVVGESMTSGGQLCAFIWRSGEMTDLNTQVDPNLGWELTRATGINDLGQVVGYGTKSGQTRAFLMTPDANDPNAGQQFPGVLGVEPADGLSSSGNQGGPFSPSHRVYTLTNTGQTAINWSATKTQLWVTLSSGGGLLAPGASTTVTVSINGIANGIVGGVYNDTITFTNTTNGYGNTTRPARLTIISPGNLSVSPADGLGSSGSQGGPFSPAAKDFTLQNTGGVAINWSASKGQSWVTLSGSGGSLAPGATVNVNVSINANANALGPGGYSDSVSFTNTTNGNGSTSRAVSLTINALPAPGQLTVTPAEGLNSSGNRGGPFSPSSKDYTLQNTGGAAINWSASKGQSWVALSSTGGSLAPGATTLVSVSIDGGATSLAAGDYADTVSFSNTTNHIGDSTRAVSLSVQATNNNPPGNPGCCGAAGPGELGLLFAACWLGLWRVHLRKRHQDR